MALRPTSKLASCSTASSNSATMTASALCGVVSRRKVARRRSGSTATKRLAPSSSGARGNWFESSRDYQNFTLPAVFIRYRRHRALALQEYTRLPGHVLIRRDVQGPPRHYTNREIVADQNLQVSKKAIPTFRLLKAGRSLDRASKLFASGISRKQHNSSQQNHHTDECSVNFTLGLRSMKYIWPRASPCTAL